MKKLNDALNEVHDNYIEEAAKADRLEKSTAKTVRNIAIPVASVAAVTGLCIGLNSMGVFGGKQGVDLLPANSGSSASASTSQTVPYEPNDYDFPQLAYLPVEIPLSLQTRSDIESIIFGSEFPEMLYADEEKVIFTEGVGGVYVFDFAKEEITFAADIYDSLYLSVDEFDYTGYDSWNGVSIFALEDGTICCSLARQRFSTISSHTDYDYEFYVLDMDELKLTRDESLHENDPVLYDGLFELPYDEDLRAMSLKGARIGDTGDFVYIRNCTADIDLLPMYNMQYIELRRWNENEIGEIEECMDGGWFPFDDPVGKEITIYSGYSTIWEDDVTQHKLYMNEVEFNFDTHGSISRVPQGDVTIKGDIIKLVEKTTGYIWLYRAEGNQLISLDVDPQAEVPENSLETMLTSERLEKIDGYAPLEDALDEAYKALVLQYEQAVEDYLNATTKAEKDAAMDGIICYEPAVLDVEKTLARAGRPVEKSAVVDVEALDAASDKLDTMKDEIAEYEEMISLLNERAEAMRDRIDSLEHACYNAPEGDIGYIKEEINALTEKLDNTLADRDDIDEHLAALEDQCDYIESMIQQIAQYEAESESIEMEAAFVKYMKEYLGADSVKTGNAPALGLIINNARSITTYFGYDEWRGGTHYGIDIAADGGEPIYAAADGVAYVPEMGNGWFNGYGNTVVIEHENGYYTVYAHAKDVVVSDGAKVKAGQEIAHVGNTGNSTGNHLHFEVRKGIEAVDPLDHIVLPSETYSNFNAIIDEKKAELSPNANIPQLAAPINQELATLTERAYGNGGYYGHNGIDIAAEYGTPVNAVADGKVVAADWLGGYGMCVILEHDGYLTLYAHLSEFDTMAGRELKAGEQVGWVGSTGQATGSHLHFEIITASDDIIDPLEYLPEFINDVSVNY